ncbi:MAG: S8 family serine peptidase [Fusicatenibacter sp.]|nr:S8 family serine peptidase [Fusicatenibacter sp.]
MKCPYCNKEIPDQAKFCGFCGNKISEDKKSETGKKDNNGNRNDKGNKHKKGKGLKILFGLILSVIIVVFVLFAMAVKRQMSINEEQKENTAPEEAYYKTFEKEEIRYENGILYVDSRLLLTAEEGIAYSEIEKKVQSVGGEIIGYIPLTGDYQIQFQEKDYAELEKLIGELKGTNEIAEATLENVIEMGFDSVDYETDPWISAAYPADRSGRSWSTFFPDGANWWAEAIGMPQVWKMDQDFAQVNVGLIDSYFDRTNEDLVDAFAQDGIIGQDDLDVSQLYQTAVEAENQNQALEPTLSSSALAHGSVDAGIIGARNNGFGICGISQNANLYGVSVYGNSDHWNVSLMNMKYGIAALLEKNVKVISISMGWDSLLFAAQQEDTGEDDRTDVAIHELNQYRNVMETFLKRCLKKYDFLIIKAAGNNSGYEYVEVDINEEHPYGYRKAEAGDSKRKRIHQQCDSKYDVFGSITDDEVKEHILVVGSVDLANYKQNKYTIGSVSSGTATDTTIVNSPSFASKWYKYTISGFSNTGDRVNLYAPGGGIIENDKKTNIGILSDYPTNITEYMQGTSQAAPMVAGTVSLILGIHPEFTAKQVRQILLTSTQKLKEEGKEFCLLNTYAAVRKAQDTKPEETEKKEDRPLLLGYAYTIVQNEEDEESIQEVEAEITIVGKSDGIEQKVELDEDDTFSIFLTAGEYTIKATAEGYEESLQEITISEGQANFVSILMVEEVEDISVAGVWLQEGSNASFEFTFTEDGRVSYVCDEAEYNTIYSINGNRMILNLINISDYEISPLIYEIVYDENSDGKRFHMQLASDNLDTDTSGLGGIQNVIEGWYSKRSEVEEIEETISENAQIKSLQELDGIWKIDDNKTMEVTGKSMNNLFGTAYNNYGCEMEISEDGSFSFYIGAGNGGEGTCWLTDNRIDYEIQSYEDGILISGSLNPAENQYLVMDYYGEKIYWTYVGSNQ